MSHQNNGSYIVKPHTHTHARTHKRMRARTHTLHTEHTMSQNATKLPHIHQENN